MTTLFVPYAMLEACAHWYNGMMDPLYALYCRATCPPYKGIGELTYHEDEAGYPVDLDEDDIAALDGMADSIRDRGVTEDMDEDDERAVWAADVWVNVSLAHDEAQERVAFWELTRALTKVEVQMVRL